MELQKTAQQSLFMELAKSEIKAHQNPEYNGYRIEQFGIFKSDLLNFFQSFEKELNDNLTSWSPSLAFYLKDIQKTLETILK